MNRLSVVLVTLNEEANIKECLRSVPFADEIVVLDSGSQDRTAELARTFTDKVYVTDFEGYGKLKREAVERANGDWIFSIDADERVSPDLAREIIEAVGAEDGCVGYLMPRRTHFLGQWIMHGGWYPGHVLRLFRKDSGEFTDSLVHEQVRIQGRVGKLRSDLLHYSDPDLRHYLWKLDRFTGLSARELHSAGRKTGASDLVLRPAFTFLKMYLLKRGFLDGIHGLILALLSSVHVLLKYVKLWEKQRIDPSTG
jgi:glycosyltransferase involved in cell wall biosynthesis